MMQADIEASDLAYLFSKTEEVSKVVFFSMITGNSIQAVSLTIFSTMRISTLVLSVTVGSWRTMACWPSGLRRNS